MNDSRLPVDRLLCMQMLRKRSKHLQVVMIRAFTRRPQGGGAVRRLHVQTSRLIRRPAATTAYTINRLRMCNPIRLFDAQYISSRFDRPVPS